MNSAFSALKSELAATVALMFTSAQVFLISPRVQAIRVCSRSKYSLQTQG